MVNKKLDENDGDDDDDYIGSDDFFEFNENYDQKNLYVHVHCSTQCFTSFLLE